MVKAMEFLLYSKDNMKKNIISIKTAIIKGESKICLQEYSEYSYESWIIFEALYGISRTNHGIKVIITLEEPNTHQNWLSMYMNLSI